MFDYIFVVNKFKKSINITRNGTEMSRLFFLLVRSQFSGKEATIPMPLPVIGSVLPFSHTSHFNLCT